MDKDAEYAEFVSARWLMLVRAALALGCTLAEAEDVAQATLVKVYVAWAKVARADHQDAYVSKMLVNVRRDALRKRRETPVAVLPDNTIVDVTGHFDASDAIRRAVRKLSQGQREVIALRYYIRLTEPEIASVLGIAPGTVKSRLSRALGALSTDTDLTDLRDGGTL
ncbi:SigE family RNA polymerase sigma factor [Nocardioides sp.]|uniref:SigE family RNA polymerase sigma factor n=1 Tax=Nocardioides sp. TaxID=35761 RepID=UPI00356830AF